MVDAAAILLGALGLVVFLFPGAAWTWALVPRAGWARGAPLTVVMAFTLAPAVMMLLNVFFYVPIRLDTIAPLCIALGLLGVAVRIAPGVMASASG